MKGDYLGDEWNSERRVPREKRRGQLLLVMCDVYAEAEHEADFVARKIAERAGVSETLFMRLVGPEYRETRLMFTGTLRTPETAKSELHLKFAALQSSSNDLQAKYDEHVGGDLAAAILHIEQQDDMIVARDARIAQLEKERKQSALKVPAAAVPEIMAVIDAHAGKNGAANAEASEDPAVEETAAGVEDIIDYSDVRVG